VKPAAAADTGRMPYSERDRQTNEFCTCIYSHSERDGIITRHERARLNPACPLHGTSVKPAPF